jgi:hypothetical protein
MLRLNQLDRTGYSTNGKRRADSRCRAKDKIIYHKNHFEHAGAAGGFIDKFGYPFCRGRIFYEIEEDKGQYEQAGEVFWASGAAMFIKKKSAGI